MIKLIGRMGILLILFLFLLNTLFLGTILAQTKQEHGPIEEVIDKVDSDKDGKISQEEYHVYCKIEKFEDIDSDNNGYIDSAELMKAVFTIYNQPPWNDWGIEVLAKRYITKGRAYFLQGKLDEAIAEYDKGIEAYPEWGDIYLNLADVYRKKGEKDKEIKNYKKAVRAIWGRSRAQAYLGLAHAHFNKNMYHEALQEFREVLRLDPKNHFAISGEKACLTFIEAEGLVK